MSGPLIAMFAGGGAHRRVRRQRDCWLFCAKCKGRMVGNPQRGRRRYICRATGELHMAIDASRLDDNVVDEAAERPDPDFR